MQEKRDTPLVQGSDSEKAAPSEAVDPSSLHPFADNGRRSDVTFYPPGMVMQLKQVNIHSVSPDDRAVELSDEKGNFYRLANIPYVVVSYDPGFDPDTEGRLIRATGEIPQKRGRIV